MLKDPEVLILGMMHFQLNRMLMALFKYELCHFFYKPVGNTAFQRLMSCTENSLP